MRFLGVHPGPLLYTKVFLRLEPLGPELVAAGGAARRSRGAADRPAGRGSPRLFPRRSSAGGRMSSRSPAIIWQTCPRSSISPRRRRRAFPASSSASAGTARPSPRPRSSRMARGDRLRAEGRGRGGDAAAAGGGRGRPRPGDGAGCGHRSGRRAAARFCPFARRAEPGARSAAPSPQIFHRHLGPVRLDRIFARLPVGLLVLQRLDLLRPQLSARQHRAGRRGSALDPRARHLHRRRRGLYSRAPRHRGRRGDRPRRHQEALLPRNPRRRAAAQQGGVPAVARGSGSRRCFSASRRSTRRG